MAHKGNVYKLQFRRDLGLDVLNNQKYGEAYNCLFGFLGGAKGSLLAGVSFQCICTDKGPGRSLKWVSGPVSISVYTWTASITVPDAAIPIFGFGEYSWELRENGARVVWADHATTSSWHYDDFHGLSEFPDVHYTPGYQPTLGPTSFGGLVATYATYNP